MKELNPFLIAVTEPFVAISLSIFISLISSLIYCSILPRETRKHSILYRLIGSNEWRSEFLSVITFFSFLASLITFLFRLDREFLPNTEGIGIYIYLIAFSLLLFIYTKPYVMEKRKIKAEQKYQLKKVAKFIKMNTQELEKINNYEGKIRFKIDKFLYSLNEMSEHVVFEAKVKKSRENIYESISRIKGIEFKRKEIVDEFTEMFNYVEETYDKLYEMEAQVTAEKYEQEKKLLNIAKEKLNTDPFEANLLLQRVQMK